MCYLGTPGGQVTNKELIHTMPQANRFSLPALLALTTLPALVVGAGLWFLGDLAPQCQISETSRLSAPNDTFDLVVFSRNCGGTTPANAQAALVPLGETMPEDAASFVSVGQATDFAAAWTDDGEIALSLPPGAKIYRNDDHVAGVTVRYR